MTYDQWKTRNLDDEMMDALDEDGEKLRQLTGDDHGPWDAALTEVDFAKCDQCEHRGRDLRKVATRYGIDTWLCAECAER